MKVTVQSPGFKATKRLQSFVAENVEKLELFYDRILESQVCLKIDNTEKVDNKICELRVLIPGDDLFASKQSGTFEESTMKAVDALKHQIEKIKTQEIRQRIGDRREHAE